MRRACASISWRSVVGGSVVALVGCTPSADSHQSVVVVDSAGIEIVENRPEAVPATWMLESTPMLDIGNPDGPSETQLHEVSAALRVNSDRYFVANDGSYEIREYNAGGALVRAFGREGEGPGEFRSVDSIILASDTLIAFDRRLRRFNRFSLEGDYLSSSTLQGQGIGLFGAPQRMSDGSFVAAWSVSTALTQADSGQAVVGTIVRGEVLLVRHASSGEVLDTVGTFPGNEEGLIESAGYPASTRAPFALGLSFASWAGRIVVGTQEHFDLQVYDRNSLVRIIRAPHPDSVVTPAMFAELVDRLVAQAPSPEMADYIASSIDSTPRSDRVPAFGRFVAASDGRLWIAEHAFWYLTARTWYVFEPTGVRVATVIVPERFRLLDAGADYVLGVWRDHLDVEHLRLFTVSGAT